MPDIALTAETGRRTGSSSARRLRATGKIPAVIYGHGAEPTPIAVDGRELRAALTTDAGTNALITLKMDGEEQLTMAKVLQRDPVRRTITHVDFLVVRRDEIVTADVAVHLVGEARLVLQEDGVVAQELFNVTVKTTPDKIPNEIEVDVSQLEIGGTIRVADLSLPQGVEVDLDPEDPVVVGQGPQKVEELEVAEEAAEEAEEAAAEGAPGEAPEGESGEAAEAKGTPEGEGGEE